MAVVVHVWEGLWGHAALDILIPKVPDTNRIITDAVKGLWSTPDTYEELATQPFIERHYISFHPEQSDKELRKGELTKGVAFDNRVFTYEIDHQRWLEKNEATKGSVIDRIRKIGQPLPPLGNTLGNTRYLLFNLDEDAMRDYWLEFSEAENAKYQLLFQNCSTVVATLLAIGWYARENEIDHSLVKKALSEVSEKAGVSGWQQFLKASFEGTVWEGFYTPLASKNQLQDIFRGNPASFAAAVLKGSGKTLNTMLGNSEILSTKGGMSNAQKMLIAGMFSVTAFIRLMHEAAWNPEKIRTLAQYLQSEVG
jgi:hypothetical protein